MRVASPANAAPGASATGMRLVGVIGFGLVVAFMVLVLAFTAVLAGSEGGHLPWPAVQWVLGTPMGVLLAWALLTLAGGLPFALADRALERRELAHAVDVTESPPDARPRRPGVIARDRWLGRGRRAQWRTVMLTLVAALVLAAACGVFVAITMYGFANRPACATGCPPMYPASTLVSAAAFGAIWVGFLAQYVALRRVEAVCGIQLRGPTRAGTAVLFGYVRRPGVTAAEARAALERVVGRPTADAPPLLAQLALRVLALAPLLPLIGLSLGLTRWLQLQWLPG